MYEVETTEENPDTNVFALFNKKTKQLEKHLNILNTECLKVGLKRCIGKQNIWQTMQTVKIY